MSERLNREETIYRLRSAAPALMPSLLLCDFGNLEQEVRRLEEANVAALHFDVMDGRFVPNITYGMPLLASLRDRTELVFDAHLMIEKPKDYIEQFYEAGADLITIHTEAVADAAPVLEKVRALGAAAGLAINLDTPAAEIEAVLPLCDVVLVMSVQAGFGGQSFDRSTLEKIAFLKEHKDCHALLEIDGGVNTSTIADCAEAGADLLVAGSAIFRADDYTKAVSSLTQLATDAAGQAEARAC